METEQKQPREFKGIWIPAEIWLNKNLSLVEKVMFAEIDSLDVKEKGCHASNQYFAAFFSLSEIRVSQIISKLVHKKLVFIQSFDGRKRVLRSCLKINFKAGLKESLRLPDEKLSNIDNKDNNKDNNKKNIATSSPLNGFKPSLKIKEIIDVWNSLNIQQHTNPETKTYQAAHRYLRTLMHGAFGELVDLDRAKLEKHKIPVQWLRKKWTQAELIEGVQRLGKLFKPGYFAENNRLPKQLDKLIFNPMTSYSSLLFVLRHEPTLKPKIKCNHPELLKKYETFFKSFYNQVLTEKELDQLPGMVNSIVKFQKEIHAQYGEERANTGFSSVCGSTRPDNFIVTHIEFMKTRKKIDLSCMRVGSYAWQDFIKWIHSYHGYKI